VTTFTNGKIITAKSPLPIVTAHAAFSAGSGVMIQWCRRSDLSTLRHSRSNVVAIDASVFLMFRMTKANAESLSEFRRAPVAAQLMTGAARRDITSL
jgi:hypothetical protein